MEPVDFTVKTATDVNPIRIAVYPVDAYVQHNRLLTALEDLFGVSCVPCRKDEFGAYRFAILLTADEEEIAEVRKLGIRAFVCTSGEELPRVC